MDVNTRKNNLLLENKINVKYTVEKKKEEKFSPETKKLLKKRRERKNKNDINLSITY